MLFVTLLLVVPSATAITVVPPGPQDSPDAWISPTLFVFDMQDRMPIGWVYSDGDMYVATSSLVPIPTGLGVGLSGQTRIPKIEKFNPLVPWGIRRTTVPFSTSVMVFGFVPGVVVPPGEAPPPVTIVITWNGVPLAVTLTRDEIVGYQYPPELHPNKVVPYEFTYPYDPEAPWKDAEYNIWVGDINDVMSMPMDLPWGYYFWYIFHPNTGDWIAWNSQGETKHPPTYDITALFEYSTSQIWFNHVAFDVEFLHAHRLVDWANFPWPLGNEIIDELIVINYGKVAATAVDVYITVPACFKLDVIPVFVKARITGGRNIGPIDITDDFIFGEHFDLPEPFDVLYPGETLRIMMKHELFNINNWSGTLVFDSMVSAWEIPSWKYPRAMHSLIVGTDGFTGIQFLWYGWKLLPLVGDNIDSRGYVFTFIPEWPVLTPICRAPFPPQGSPRMILDPDPIDLNGDGKIDGKEVAMVRRAIVGLDPVMNGMDLNANGKVDTHDLARYKLAAG